MNKGRLLPEGPPDRLKVRADGLTFTAMPPEGMPARQLQARLIDAPDLVVDAMPRDGNVRFIRQPQASGDRLITLLDGAPGEPRPEELDDAFMMLLRQQESEAPTTPGKTHELEGDGAPEKVANSPEGAPPRPPGQGHRGTQGSKRTPPRPDESSWAGFRRLIRTPSRMA